MFEITSSNLPLKVSTIMSEIALTFLVVIIVAMVISDSAVAIAESRLMKLR